MATRLVTMSNVGATSSAWTADRDYVLDAVYQGSTTSAYILSSNPTLAVTSITAPGTTQVHEDVISWGTASANMRAWGAGPLGIPISAGKTLYFVTATAGTSISFLLNDAVDIS